LLAKPGQKQRRGALKSDDRREVKGKYLLLALVYR
jgi:hypothetical protein